MNEHSIAVIGWDIGGVNTKASALLWHNHGEPAVRTAGSYFEVWRDPARLTSVLTEVAADLNIPSSIQCYHAITLTAELSDAFRTKSDGVLFVFNAVRAALPHAEIFALRLDEQFIPLNEARLEPRSFAAANWLAGALYIASLHPACLWIDCGSTTTDIIPIVDSTVRAEGRTDMARLSAGELVYTGALRTPLGAVAATVPLRGRPCRTAPEFFATTADVHLVLGHITPQEYTSPTADGRAISSDASLERIARTVCADGDSLTPDEISALARAFDEAQVTTIINAVLQVLSRFTAEPSLPVLVTGSGAFIGWEVARRLHLPTLASPALHSPQVAEILPCYAVATLLARHLALSTV